MSKEKSLLELSDLRRFFDTLKPDSRMAKENLESARKLLNKSISEFNSLKSVRDSVIYADKNCRYEAPPEFQDAVKLARRIKC